MFFCVLAFCIQKIGKQKFTRLYTIVPGRWNDRAETKSFIVPDHMAQVFAGVGKTKGARAFKFPHCGQWKETPINRLT